MDIIQNLNTRRLGDAIVVQGAVQFAVVASEYLWQHDRLKWKLLPWERQLINFVPMMGYVAW